MSSRPASDRSRRRNLQVGVLCAAALSLMVGAAYASVPLYRAFCQLTGFDGTVRRAEAAPSQVLNQTLKVRFDTNVSGGLPWTFAAEQASQTIRIGQTGTAFFKVTNTSNRPITGRAVYNVVPELAGPYFRKLQCFCFSDQTLQPGQSVDFPMIYFVDPAFANDRETRNAPEITLSYTFFPAPEDGAAKQAAASPLGGTQRAGL
ncbi:MAG: cytochrome c oxidase assembly protein [Phenylobacterium sp.]